MNNSSFLIARIANMSQWLTQEYFRIKDLPEEFKKTHILNDIFPGYIESMDKGLTATEIFKNENSETTIQRLNRFEEMMK